MKRVIANQGIPVLLTLVSVTWIASAFMVFGCGKKAPPKPPTGDKPPKVIDLAYSIRENTIKLSWTIPKTSAKAKSPVTGFSIYRSKQSSAFTKPNPRKRVASRPLPRSWNHAVTEPPR